MRRDEGFALDRAEAILHRLTAAFGGDPAAIDAAARLLRMPRHQNWKFAEPVAA